MCGIIAHRKIRVSPLQNAHSILSACLYFIFPFFFMWGLCVCAVCVAVKRTHKLFANMQTPWIRHYGAHLVPDDKYTRGMCRTERKETNTKPYPRIHMIHGLWCEIFSLSPNIVFPSILFALMTLTVVPFVPSLRRFFPLHIFPFYRSAKFKSVKQSERFFCRNIAGVAAQCTANRRLLLTAVTR